jgi:hypothetical protein
MSSLQKFHRRTQPFKVNTLHTGTVTISGTATRDQVLTANNTLADVDGLGTFSYQWKRSGSAISGATDSTYTLVAADVGNTITVTITYTDGHGFIETETSVATASVTVPISIGDGSASKGYWLATAGDGVSKLIVAPKSTEVQLTWGSNGTVRGTTSNTDGVTNTNTLAAFGQAAHPAAYYCKTLSAGGYNTWYLPAWDELRNVQHNKNATPFATANSFLGAYYYTSTESTRTGSYLGKYGLIVDMTNGSGGAIQYKTYIANVRAVRRTTIFTL